MKKENLVKIIVIIYCLISILLGKNLFLQVNDDKTIFKDRLYKYLMAPSNLDFSASEKQKIATKNLLSFSEEFPDSSLSDDAQFITLLFNARNATDEDSAFLQKIIEKYPNGKIDSYTIQCLEGFSIKSGIGMPSKIYVPYDLVLVYFRGENAWRNRNYNEMIRYFSEFIKRTDESNLKTKDALYMAYLYSLGSYNNLDRKAEGEKIKSKMISLFPEKKDQIEKIYPGNSGSL